MSDTNKRHSTTRKVSLKEDVRTAVYREINRKLVSIFYHSYITWLDVRI